MFVTILLKRLGSPELELWPERPHAPCDAELTLQQAEEEEDYKQQKRRIISHHMHL